MGLTSRRRPGTRLGEKGLRFEELEREAMDWETGQWRGPKDWHAGSSALAAVGGGAPVGGRQGREVATGKAGSCLDDVSIFSSSTASDAPTRGANDNFNYNYSIITIAEQLAVAR